MSEQTVHSLKQAGIMIALAVLGVLASDTAGVVRIMEEAGVNPLYFGIVTAVIAGLVRWFEGMRDAKRAENGQIVPADVGYTYIYDQATNTPTYEYPMIAEDGSKNVQV